MMEQQFSHNLRQACALAPGSHVLMAVSGGADSVAMLRLFVSVRASFPLTLSCAHVEHGIRGKDSLDDLSFVRALCKRENIPLYAARVDAPGYARANGCGLEDAARTSSRWRITRAIRRRRCSCAHRAGATCAACARCGCGGDG